MSFIKSVIEQILDHAPFLKRLAQKANVSLNDGLGAYLLSMIAVSVACVFAWHAMDEGMADTRKLQAFESLLPQEQEPLRDERSGAFVASVLQGIGDWTLCRSDPYGFTSATADGAARYFEHAYNSNASPQPQLRAEAASPVGLNSGVGQGMMWSYSDSLTLIPSQVASANPSNSRYREAIDRRQIIESFKGLVGRQASQHIKSFESLAKDEPFLGNEELPEFKAVYFISVDGVFQITPPPMERLSPHQLFHHRSYVLATVGNEMNGTCSAGGRRYHSRPYLDMVGNGIVSTVCYPVFRQQPLKASFSSSLVNTSLPSSPPGGPQKDLAGSFCIDFSPPLTLLRKNLGRNPFFKAWLVRLTDTGPAKDSATRPDISLCGDTDFKCVRDDGKPLDTLQPKTKEEKRLATRLARELAKRLPAHSPNGGIIIIDDEQSGATYYGVKLWQSTSTSPRVQEVAILSTAKRNYRMELYWLGCIASCVFAAAVVASARGAHERIRESALLRGVQHGVLHIRTNRHGVEFIVGANDRAEELLGIELPRLGIPEPLWGNAATPLEFRRIVAEPLIAVPFIDEWVNKDIKWKEFSEVFVERRRGVPSEYYIKYHSGTGQNWFKATGSPILKPDGSLEMFSIFERANPADATLLETMFHQEKRKSNGNSHRNLA